MSTDLRLHHELLLLALHDDKGTLVFGQMVELGLAGAVLAELLLEERVVLKPEGRKGRPLVTVVSRATLGDEVLDAGLRRLTDAKRRADPARTVSRLSGIPQLRNRTALALCRRGVLREEEDRVLVLFKRRVYPTVDPGPEQALVQRVRRAVDEPDADVGPRTALLVALARATHALRAIWTAKELRARKARLEALSTLSGPGGAAAREAVQAAEAAMMVVMASTVAATAAATGGS
ncbi:MAG TPA: GPP34 family phosphoprotein [Longimicrobiales bacterium]|nr:GPP34 family phosphoprotein [Longimicrobiales bacterium]